MLDPRRLAPPFGLCVALSGFVVGCQHFDRARECRSVSALVNPVLRTIEAERQKAPTSAATFRAIAIQYDRLGGAIVALRPHDRQVQDAVGDYQKLTREAARDARLFADALDAEDVTRIAAARLAAAHTLKHEGAALSRLGVACRTR